MAIRKRGDLWHVDITAPDGTRIRHSAGTADKRAAQEYHDKLKTELWQQARLGVKADVLWEDAAVRYLKEVSGKKSYRDYARHLAFWTQHFRGMALKDISRTDIAKLVEQAVPVAATRNRYVATIRAMLIKAECEWEVLQKAPPIKTYTAKNARIRWITREEAERLLSGMPAWMRDMAEFALATGLRQANVFKLRWDMVDMRMRIAGIPGEEFKTGRFFACHLNQEAAAIIARQLGKHQSHVFVNAKGKAMQSWPTTCDRIWKKCLERAGITDFRWHDLRHTWASWHVQAGTDIYTLKELGGWETLEMPMRYAHLSATHLKDAANRVVLGTNSSQALSKTEACS